VILHVREANIWGSPERLILGQIRFLQGHTCVPVTYRRLGRSNPFAEGLHREGVGCIELAEFGPGDLRAVYRLARIIRDRRADLVVTHDFKSNLYGHLASRMTGCPHLVHFHGVTAEGWKVRFYNAIDRGVMRRCRAIITVAEQTRQRLISMGVDGGKIEVVINAVAPEAFDQAADGDLTLEPGRKLIVAAGRLSHEKGMDIVVKAARILKDQGLQFDIRIYGEGPERARLQALLARLDVGDCVTLAGFRSDLRPVYARAEFLVIPSRSEAFPLVLLEAWAQGIPVVATPVGRLPELIESGVDGLLAERVAPDSLAKVIGNALGRPTFRERCGVFGRDKVRDQFSFPVQVAALKQIYERHMRSSQRP
jgi:glycosyltransferase involved in cell wall biosynthesis